MLLAPASVWAALLSGVIHILVFGWIATLLVATPAARQKLLNVALIQRALPLPVGEFQGQAGAALAPPAKKPARSVPSLQSPPQVKKIQPKPKSPQPVAEKPRPAVSVPPLEKIDTDPQAENSGHANVANLGLTDSIDSSGFEGTTSGNGVLSGSGQESGRGGGGTAAQPNYHINPKPPYPRIARRLGAQGVVTLRVFVLKDGGVGQAEVLHSSGFRMLDDSALRTVRSAWRFLPALHDGVAIDSWVEVPIKFVLEVS